MVEGMYISIDGMPGYIYTETYFIQLAALYFQTVTPGILKFEPPAQIDEAGAFAMFACIGIAV